MAIHAFVDSFRKRAKVFLNGGNVGIGRVGSLGWNKRGDWERKFGVEFLREVL